MNSWKRPREEILHHFFLQRKALRASAKNYDEGEKWEAYRLATIVYVIVHDGGKKSKSIMTQLGIRASTKFVSTSISRKGNLLPESPLVITRLSNKGAEYIPALDNGPIRQRLVQFPRWWSDETVYRSDSFFLNRRKLVFSLRNKDGGSHLDPEIDDEGYMRMSRPSPFSAYYKRRNEKETPVLGMELAAMRHVAWELETSLDMIDPIS